MVWHHGWGERGTDRTEAYAEHAADAAAASASTAARRRDINLPRKREGGGCRGRG